MVKEKKKNGNKTLEELAKFIQSPSKLTFQRAKKLLRPICGRTLLGQLLKDIVLEAFNRGEERPFLATIQFYTHIDAAEREYGKNTQFNRLALNERFQIGKACILDDQNKTDKKIADTLENKLGTTTFFQAMYYETSVSLFELEKDKIPSTVLSAAKHLILYGLSLQRPFFVQEGADMLKQIINNNNPNINALLSRVYYEQGKYLESLEIIEKISNCENLEELTYMPKDIKRFKRKLMRSIKQNRSRLCYFIDRFEIDSLDHRILSHNNSIEGGEGHNNFNETIAQIEKFLDSTAHNKTKEKEYFMCIQAYNEALIKLLKPKKRLPQQLEADINLLIAKNCLRSEDIKAAERYCKKAIKLADEEESRLSHMCLLAQIYEHQYSLLPNPFGSGFIGKSQNQMLALWQKIILTYVERFVQRLETAPPVTSINVASNENLANHGILIKRETDTTAFERTSAFTMLTQKRDAMYIDFFHIIF